MLEALRRPFSNLHLAAASLALAAAVALYCLAYNSLAGHAESFTQSLAWALANASPWLIAMELAKRAKSIHEAAGTLFGAMIISLALGYVLGASGDPLAFETMRRVPAVIVSAAAVALLRSGVGRGTAATGEIPLLPRQIEWIRAAGNYIELRSNGRTIVHRSSIGAAEQLLAQHGFVRIHRSTLVRRDQIARVRPTDVVLTDGTHFKVGQRYRAMLLQHEIRPFVTYQ